MPSRHIDLIRWGDAKETYAKPTQKMKFHVDWDGNWSNYYTAPVVIDGPENYDEGRTFDPEINQVFPIPAKAFDGTINLKQNIGY